MKEFLLVFRRDTSKTTDELSPEQQQAQVQKWQDWIGKLAAQDRLARQPQKWSAEARVVKGQEITNGAYAEIKESIGGLLFVKASSFDDAVEIAKGCPVLGAPWYGNVEIRMDITG